MVNFFVYQIIDGRCTLNDIHKLWRAKVQARLRELGLDDNGRPLGRAELDKLNINEEQSE
ncbi:hypothetical protein [Enterococcus cecorum]|uniref:hypothetical protein n=1 Tax=Enterococcus cecorum TaxID=44008 RepID=UPI003F2412F3